MNGPVSSVLTKISREYPQPLAQEQESDIPRIAFNMSLAVGGTYRANRARYEGFEVCDLGGGIGLFSVGCAALGCSRSVLVDDFDDSINHDLGMSILDIHRAHGVEVISRDVVKTGIADLHGAFDAITSFDSMEHWHQSPKALFSQVVDKLKPGGVFVLGVPNCVSARKRITVPFGKGRWSSMADWYESSPFRGHVREPEVDDLLYIARDMRLVDVRVVGRNWLGYNSARRVVRIVTALVDRPLRFWPTLCADIYMIGRKPSAD
jgi:SAM-dependent methyltransferase